MLRINIVFHNKIMQADVLPPIDEQDQSYRDAVLPPAVTRRVAVEAGVSNDWYRYVGTRGAVLGMDCFGMSAPAPEVFKHFGFTVENLRKIVTEIL